MAQPGVVNPRDIEEQVRRFELRERYRFELESQRREWRIRIGGSAWIFTAFLISWLSVEMVKAVTIIGFITSFALHLLSWQAYRGVSRELGTFQ